MLLITIFGTSNSLWTEFLNNLAGLPIFFLFPRSIHEFVYVLLTNECGNTWDPISTCTDPTMVATSQSRGEGQGNTCKDVRTDKQNNIDSIDKHTLVNRDHSSNRIWVYLDTPTYVFNSYHLIPCLNVMERTASLPKNSPVFLAIMGWLNHHAVDQGYIEFHP